MNIFLTLVLALLGSCILYLAHFTWSFHRRYLFCNDEYAALWKGGDYKTCLRFSFDSVITEKPHPVKGFIDHQQIHKSLKKLQRDLKENADPHPLSNAETGYVDSNEPRWVGTKEFYHAYSEFTEYMESKYVYCGKRNHCSNVNWRYCFPAAMLRGDHPNFDQFNPYHVDYVEEMCRYLDEFTLRSCVKQAPVSRNDVLVSFLHKLAKDMNWENKLPKDYRYRLRY